MNASCIIEELHAVVSVTFISSYAFTTYGHAQTTFFTGTEWLQFVCPVSLSKSTCKLHSNILAEPRVY